MASKAVTISKKVNTPATEGTYYRLLCMTGKNKGLSYYINGNRVVMGRSDKVDVTVLDQKSSREHCELVRHGNTFVLTDLGSQNGVMINDLKVTQHRLNDGDKIIIGKTVYKYNKIVVTPTNQEDDDEDEEDEDFELEADKDGEEQDQEGGAKKKSKKNKKDDPAQKRKRLIIVGAVLAVGILFIDTGEQKEQSKKPAQASKNKMDDLTSETTSSEEHEDPEVQKQIEVHIHRGLREYREKNYFRAIKEFNLALILSPNHGSASYYLRKTKQTLNEDVEQFFMKARQEFDSLKYREAISSYCSIIRILQERPGDQRYKDAMKNIEIIEKKMGLGPGEISCIEE